MESVDVLQSVQENLNVRRVFGDPVQSGDATILPVATVGGGGGAGHQAGKDGVGFGLGAKPAGVFVIRNGEAKWRPAFNVNLIVAGGQIVALAGIFALTSFLRHRRRTADGK